MIDISALKASFQEGRLSLDEKNILAAEYEKLFGKMLNKRCKNCFMDAMAEIQHEYNKENNVYFIRRGLTVKIDGKVYHTNQLTKEQAQQFLIDNPDQEYKFE